MAASEKNGVSLVIIVGLSCLVVSLVLILLLHNEQPVAVLENNHLILPSKSIWSVIGEHIATALFILGVWHTMDYLLIRKAFNNEIIAHFNGTKEDLTKIFHDASSILSDGVTELKGHFATASHDALFGLVSTHHDANHYDLSQLIKTSKHFVAVMADGHTWTSRHIEAFRERFKDPNRQTTFILVHPESEQVRVIAHKINDSPDLYRQRIYSTISQLRALGGHNGNLRFFGHSLISCHSIYIADEEIVFSPYFLSTQKRSSPIFVIRNAGEGSYFQKLASDIAYLEEESVEISLPATGVVSSGAKATAEA